jgi:hypothetical protein
MGVNPFFPIYGRRKMDEESGWGRIQSVLSIPASRSLYSMRSKGRQVSRMIQYIALTGNPIIDPNRLLISILLK